ncbi:hypothetical protein G7075_04740 [Phycicoccus sp. HDW14]|uniref:DUF6318 family protein n=1 Tax=Phycicoccus sp. HDW14 TaxID=2714941 RepID=UPI00140A355B|nr:DUF6318 family protein [Phycicoccus sp. HDW14]QIM20618.1 hypothetical protein G7075_04740 [Phycicoccus sp. HDW14]
MLAAGILVGCDSSSDDPVVTPSPSPSVSSSSPSPSPSSSPSVTESGPQIPAAAREKTPKGAEAYVKYFFDQFNLAYTRPQVGLIESMSTPGCEFCSKSEVRAVGLAEDRQRYAQNPVKLEEAVSFGGAPKNEQYVRIRFTQVAATIVDSNGRQVSQVAEGTATANAALRWSGSRWFVRGIEKG